MYAIIQSSIEPFLTPDPLAVRLIPLIFFGIFSSFGLTAFVLLLSATLFSPSETVMKQVFSPLPMTPLQLRIGMLLPGLLFLFGGQLLLWGSTLAALLRPGIVSPLPVMLATLLGLFCYNSLTLVFYQGVYCLVARFFGAERTGLRTSTSAICMTLGLVGLTIPLFTGVQALIDGAPVWLWLLPSYWMTQIVVGSPLIAIASLCLLLLITILGAVLYIQLVEYSERLATGGKGYWCPLKGLPFARHPLFAGCCYEWKSIVRDQQVIIGFAFVFGIYLVGGLVLFNIRQGDPIVASVVLQLVIVLVTFLLCMTAQVSWGRDQRVRRVLAYTPLHRRIFVSSKLLANLVLVTLLWCLLSGILTYSLGVGSMFVNALPFIPLGVVLSFWLGIIFPYSDSDTTNTLILMGVISIFGFPVMTLLSKFYEWSFALPMAPSVRISILLVLYLVVLLGSYQGIIFFDRKRWEKIYE